MARLQINKTTESDECVKAGFSISLVCDKITYSLEKVTISLIKTALYKYEVHISKDKKCDYLCYSFPEPLPAPVKDYLKARFKITQEDNHSVTFIV